MSRSMGYSGREGNKDLKDLKGCLFWFGRRGGGMFVMEPGYGKMK